MEHVTIDEPVKVAAVFDGETVLPKWFVWQGRTRRITETTYTWRDNQGTARILHFAVTDGATVFELAFNQKTLAWRLESTTTP